MRNHLQYGKSILNGNDLHAFVRLGTDYTDNYYEYEIPLQVTPPRKLQWKQ
jgi:cell surface protein SprA